MKNSTQSTAFRKPYNGLKVEPIAMEYEGSICTASIYQTTTVQTSSQQVEEIDFSQDSFNHVWE